MRPLDLTKIVLNSGKTVILLVLGFILASQGGGPEVLGVMKSSTLLFLLAALDFILNTVVDTLESAGLL
jgi:hypothetical protein